jgi:hypothetical protein
VSGHRHPDAGVSTLAEGDGVHGHGYQAIKYDRPVIIVQDTRGRTEKFSVSDDGTVEDRRRFYDLLWFRRAAMGYLYSHRTIIPRRHKGVSRSHLTLRD